MITELLNVSLLGLLIDGVLSPLNLIVIAVMAVGAGIAYMGFYASTAESSVTSVSARQPVYSGQ